MDFRQVVAAILTMSMFAMLGNMIKKEHIDPWITVPVSLDVQQTVFNVKLTRLREWEMEVDAMRLCSNKIYDLKQQREQNQGYVFFSLTNGPEYHALQVAHAVFIAKHLHATLVIPDITSIRGTEKRTFGEVYDVINFMARLYGIVQVAERDEAPYEFDRDLSTTINITNRVTKEFVSSKIEPIFKKNKQVTLASYYPSSTVEKAYETSDESDDFMEPYTCLAIFGSLRLNQELRALVNTMVRTLQFLSLKSSTGQFVAMDLNVKDLEGNCQNNDTSTNNRCLNIQEIGESLNSMGFKKDTTLYITQTGWHPTLQPLRKYYPNLLTKDSLMPIDMKATYLGTNDFQYEKYIDFHLCAKSKIFTSTFSNLFYASVSGMRIALGNTKILVPPTKVGRSSASGVMNNLSPHVINKTHVAFSCLC